MNRVNSELGIFFNDKMVAEEYSPYEQPCAELLRPRQTVENDLSACDLCYIDCSEQCSYYQQNTLEDFLYPFAELQEAFNHINTPY